MIARTIAIAKKEFIQIIRDARTLAVVFTLPVLMLVLYGYGINMDVKHLKLAVLDMDETPESRSFIDVFRGSDYFSVERYLSRSEEIDGTIEREEASIAIWIPKGFGADLARKKKAQVQVIIDGSDSTTASIAVGYVSAAIQGYSRDVIMEAAARAGVSGVSQPIDYRPRVWYNPELKSSHFIVPGLIAVILMMVAALLTSMTVVREKERGTIEQLMVSPVMPGELMIGKLIPYVLISFADIIVIIGAGRVLFDVPIRGNPVLLLSISVVFLVAALAIGLFISIVAKTQQAAMMTALTATMLPSVLLSGFAFPIMNMPKVIQAITYLIPARYFLVIVRGIFLKGTGLEVLWKETLFLVIFAVFAVFLSAKKFRKNM